MEFNELIIGATYLVEWDKEKIPDWYHPYLSSPQRTGCSSLVNIREKRGEQNSDDKYSPFLRGCWRKVGESGVNRTFGWYWNGVKDCFIRRVLDR